MILSSVAYAARVSNDDICIVLKKELPGQLPAHLSFLIDGHGVLTDIRSKQGLVKLFIMGRIDRRHARE